jgi:hypothetical protein
LLAGILTNTHCIFFLFLPDDNSLATELSENSSLMGEGELLLDQSTWGEVSFTSELEQITQELANKGPPQSELELRYVPSVVSNFSYRFPWKNSQAIHPTLDL